MPSTPDDLAGGKTDADLLLLRDTGMDPEAVGYLRLNGGALKARDADGVFNLRSGAGLTEATHELIDSLVHDLAETSYTEAVRTSGQVVSVVVWTSAAKLIKVRETTITRVAGQVSVVVEQQFDAAGVLVQTLTHTITRSGGRVASIATVEA